MNIFPTSSRNDGLMYLFDEADRREELFHRYCKENPKELRDYKKQQIIELMIENGEASTVDEAEEIMKEKSKNRPDLNFCREAAEKYISQLSPEEYKGLFRMSPSLFSTIEEKVTMYLESEVGASSRGKKRIPVRYLLIGVIRWLAGGSPHDIQFLCGLRARTFRKLRWVVLDALLDCFYEEVIRLPTTEEERTKLSNGFATKMKMDGCLGGIDGLLVHIKLPAGVRNARPYRCYKSFYALNMQGVADYNGEFLYVNVGHKGATADGCAVRKSRFWQRCKDDEFKFSEGNFFVGDAAYSLMPWLMCPFEGAHGVNTREDIFNLYLSKGRQVIERAFGMMISRWRILVAPLERLTIRAMVKIIKVCCLLHNLCLRDRLSTGIVVNHADLQAHPFRPDCPKNGVVPKVRLHVDSYRTPGLNTTSESVEQNEKVLRRVALGMRDRFATDLHATGAERNKVRGSRRGAAYQV